MWRYYCLQEGTLVWTQRCSQLTKENAPVVHVDSDAPLYSDIDGSLITTRCGVLLQTRLQFDGVQGVLPLMM
ncbi:MAG: hypothetical protein CM1200mP30_03830 [Pseudomonadota bacterium]|nr:MAG: hypothetical protein CM1200mP30_03830 [Pseudomonadota bacterium]